MNYTGDLKRRRRTPTDYTVACLVPLSVELAPLRAMLDTVHDDLPTDSYRNAYVLGEMEHHNVVIAQLPSIGNNDIGFVANQLLHDFPSIQFGLLVGIAGGVPGPYGENDVRLGDVVVSEPKGTMGGVLQFDRGKKLHGERLQITGHLNKPPQFLIATVKKVAAQHHQQGNKIQELVLDMLRKNPVMSDRFGRPSVKHDTLFESDYEHTGKDDCSTCDTARTIQRSVRRSNETRIHYGTIGSSNAVIRNATERDDLGREHNLLSIEMEAAGLMDTFPCLVIRGVCDYADSHKNKRWQPYAATVAAAYAKELLQNIPPTTRLEMANTPTNYVVRVPDEATETLAVHDTEASSVDASEEHLKTLLESLAFDRMDARLWSIHEPLPQTCKWLFKHKMFQHWTDRSKSEEHHGFLWIKGKPGSGKSTIMKAALRWVKKNRSAETVVSYFFNARAKGDLEKSPLGLYRSVAYQLLGVYPQLKHEFLKTFQSKVTDAIPDEWKVPELTNFLTHVIQSLGDCSVNLFIDALDEGDDTDVRQLVAFLDDLASIAHESKVAFRICLSSRHYPHISIKAGLNLIMEDQPGHKDDIARFVEKKLVGEHSTELDRLMLEIHERAAGIFLWVVLVVPILNKVHDRGGSTVDMNLCLQQIPKELDGLFSQILARDSDGKDECLSLLQWLLFSQRALTPHELYLAIKATSPSPEVISHDMPPAKLSLYFLDRSRGLAEVTKSQTPVVQFIHETVRNFLQHHGLSQIEPSLKENVAGRCHEKLKTGCMCYISSAVPRISSVEESDRKMGQTRVNNEAPMLKYAADNMFKHAEAAEACGIRQRRFLRQNHKQGIAALDYWVWARNIFKPYKVQTYDPRVPLLYMIVEQGLEELAGVLIDDDSVNINERGGRYGCALHAACVVGSDRTVSRLLESGVSINVEGGEFEHALFAAIHSKRDSVIELLLQKHARPQLKAMRKCLWKTVARGYLRGAQALIRLGASVNMTNSNGKSLLDLAAEKRSDAMMRFLIEECAEFNTGKALLEACRFGDEKFVCFLIEKGVDVNTEVDCYGNIFQSACARGWEQVVRLLIDKGADVNAQGGIYGNALQAACSYHHKQMMRLLVSRGADTDAVEERYHYILKAALSEANAVS